MAKYKLTVKYWGVCELSFESAKKDLVTKEFDRYINSFLSNEPENPDRFKLNFKKTVNVIPQKPAETKEPPKEAEKPVVPVVQLVLEPKLSAPKAPETPKEPSQKPAEKAAKKGEEPEMTLSLKEYVKNKNITTPLDEFVAGACYMEEIHDIKEFTLKQLNARLFPVFKRLSDLGVAELAKSRMLVETKEENGVTHYSINQNAWNYHNYDLVRH